MLASRTRVAGCSAGLIKEGGPQGPPSFSCSSGGACAGDGAVLSGCRSTGIPMSISIDCSARSHAWPDGTSSAASGNCPGSSTRCLRCKLSLVADGAEVLGLVTGETVPSAVGTGVLLVCRSPVGGVPTTQRKGDVARITIVRNMTSVAECCAAAERATACMCVRISKVLRVRHPQTMTRVAGLFVVAAATGRFR